MVTEKFLSFRLLVGEGWVDLFIDILKAKYLFNIKYNH